jgi:hypothetical protein
MSLGLYGIIFVGNNNKNFVVAQNPTKDKTYIYSDYFGKIADAGLSASQEIYKTISEINSVDITTFNRNELETQALNKFDDALRNSYEHVFSNQYSLSPMSAAFEGLSKYIKIKNNINYNDFLLNNNIKVNKIYASVSNAIGIEINTENVLE